VAPTRSLVLIATLALAGGCGGVGATHSSGSSRTTAHVARPDRSSAAAAELSSTTTRVDPSRAAPGTTAGTHMPAQSTTQATAPTAPDTRPPAGMVTPVGRCLTNDDALARAVVRFAQSLSPATPMSIDTVLHAASDHTWARIAVVPATSSGDGFAVIAHCVGVQWTVVEGGSHDVGCGELVPAGVSRDLGLPC
jgi:hypothetical protein